MLVSAKLNAGRFTRILNLVQFKHLGKSELLVRLGVKMARQHARRVMVEKTDPDGGKWSKLKPSTIRKKGNDNILVDSGAMAKSWRVRYFLTFLRVQNTTKYLVYHQYGTKKMVPRPVMGVSKENFEELKVVVQTFLAQRLGAA